MLLLLQKICSTRQTYINNHKTIFTLYKNTSFNMFWKLSECQRTAEKNTRSNSIEFIPSIKLLASSKSLQQATIKINA
jgi:DUF2075 family protein